MNRHLIFGLALLGSNLVYGDQVEFAGNQRLSGDLVGAEDGVLKLRHNSALEPLELKRDRVSRIDFENPDKFVGQGAELVCLDGTRITGEVDSYADGLLVFTSPSLGRLELSSEHLASLVFLGGNVGMVFRMSGELEQWELDSVDNWAFEPRSNRMSNLKSSSSAGFRAELPMHFQISFDLKWKKLPKLEIFLGGEDLSYGAPASRYRINLNRSGLQLARTLENAGVSKALNNSEKTPYSARFDENDSASFKVEVDRRNKLIKVFVDGQPAGKFFDFENGVVEGDAVFIKTGTGDQEISNFTLKKISGAEEIERDEAMPQDRLVSIDGDSVAGTLQSIQSDEEGGKMKFTIKQGGKDRSLEVSKSRIAMLHFKGRAMDEEPDGELALTDKGEAIYGSLGKISPDFIEIENELIGKLQLKRQAAKTLEFKVKEESE